MPKDTTRRSPSPIPNAPRIKRRLPGHILDRLERRRAAGNPVKWTDKGVKAVVKYVSTLPPPSPSLPAKPITAVANKAIAAARRAGEAVHARQQREAAEASALSAATAARRDLAERISAAPAPTFTPIAPKRVGIDIPKYTTPELIGIYTPKFDATIKRLSALDDLDYSGIRADHAVAVSRLYLRLIAIRKQLRPEAIITFQEWKRYETGLRAIGEVSFVGLRRNLRRIFAELELIERAGYFE